MSSYKNKEILNELYWNKGMTQEEIGNKYDVHRKTVQYWMKKLGVDRRTPRQDRAGCFDIEKNEYPRFRTEVDGELKGVKIHRLMAVAKFGFEKVKNNVVHHKNGIKWDNRFENLELMNHGEHTKHHNEEREFSIGKYRKENN